MLLLILLQCCLDTHKFTLEKYNILMTMIDVDDNDDYNDNNDEGTYGSQCEFGILHICSSECEVLSEDRLTTNTHSSQQPTSAQPQTSSMSHTRHSVSLISSNHTAAAHVIPAQHSVSITVIIMLLLLLLLLLQYL